MTDYELYTMVERDYFKRGCDTRKRAEWWKKLSMLPLIGRFATKRAEALDAVADIYFEWSVIALKESWKVKNR